MAKQSNVVPPNWGNDELSMFLGQARSNQFATFARKKDAYVLISQIDACFVRGVKDMVNPNEMVSPFVYMRCHSAWRTASSITLAGHVTETYSLLRLALEFGAYAIFMHDTPGMMEVWLNRNESAESKKRMREAFKISNMRNAIAAHDKKLSDVFQYLYDGCIDQGAHPNQLGVMGSASIKVGDDRKFFEQIYLHGDGIPLDNTLKQLVETGICCLYVFQHIPTFKARFELLGIKDDLNELRRKSSILVKATK